MEKWLKQCEESELAEYVAIAMMSCALFYTWGPVVRQDSITDYMQFETESIFLQWIYMVLGGMGPRVRSLEVFKPLDPLGSRSLVGLGSQSGPGTAGNN